ncbi:hypothetical protein [Pseudofrankia sp. BMG5.36]|uniref:hypothetical protein n=1 Tax=Pseudofrankia sp. BMG5.36 TaxID=1834512 RepID=UPI0008DA3E15|nr:hypothetical protein [Pseudofrankia sp. BMG5.36]OHV57579.1 hypothetical protein BCD48_42880 [Pseudofrankia sp. BMG5.36]
MDTRRIPPPDPDREPLKVNVYERMAKAAAQLMPLFPYDGAGAIVPAGVVLVGGPEVEYGHFFHWNSVDEVAVTYGSRNAMLAAGQIMATQRLHGVNSFLRDEKDSEAFAVMVITQRQSSSGEQSEALTARCKNCKAELVRHSYDATPHGLPGYDAQRYGAEDDPVRQFPTIASSVEFVELRNSEEGRTCARCGHVNDVFPAARWGWARQAYQTRAVNRGYHSMVEAES